MPVMGWKSSAVAKATINPCKICQHGVTMPPNLGFDRWPRRSADGTPTCAHHPVDTGRQHAAWRVRDTAVVVVRTTMSSISCQSSRCPRTKKPVPRCCVHTPQLPLGETPPRSWNRRFRGLRGVPPSLSTPFCRFGPQGRDGGDSPRGCRRQRSLKSTPPRP